jgi:hypothetical protein
MTTGYLLRGKWIKNGITNHEWGGRWRQLTTAWRQEGYQPTKVPEVRVPYRYPDRPTGRNIEYEIVARTGAGRSDFVTQLHDLPSSRSSCRLPVGSCPRYRQTPEGTSCLWMGYSRGKTRSKRSHGNGETDSKKISTALVQRSSPFSTSSECE